MFLHDHEDYKDISQDSVKEWKRESLSLSFNNALNTAGGKDKIIAVKNNDKAQVFKF